MNLSIVVIPLRKGLASVGDDGQAVRYLRLVLALAGTRGTS